ncbi:hypothetical protein CXB51_028033 [Gossypium anomalum]|uniref:DUF7745 domain-containing protein n=1 Tax=Gossypium anomalum TaxID=47600 RepID=A0A8J5Y6S2_9ROSI|nr:hypothetical protein CXB51_028033 [Gossypium anomalum]
MGVRSYAFVRFSPSYELVDCFRDTVSIHGSISELESFVIWNEYLNKVEDNASVCTWSEKTQLEKGDSVTEGYTSELWDFTHINSTQNKFQELRDIWAQWDDEAKQLFYQNYRDLPYLLDVKVDKHLLRAMGYKAYVRPASLPTFTKKLVMITGMSEQWAVAHVKKRVDVLALSIYGMVIFPKALGHIDEAVADLFDRLGKQNTHVPAILAETIRSLSACRRTVDIPRRDDISEERWIDILQNLREEDVMWKAPWLVPSEVLYRCSSFDWGLAQSDFSYKGDYYNKRMREISEAWKKPFCMKILTEGSTSTLEYKGWFSRRVNDNVPRPILGVARSLEESLRVIPSELEVMKQEFERKNSELGKRMEKLEEEKMCLSLDVDVQKMEVEKVKKKKRKIEEDRDDLKTHYKKAQVTLKRVRLGRSSEQWQQEIQEERAKAEYWEKKFQERQSRNQALEKENQGLKVKVTELGRSLHHHRCRNFAAEVKASLNKIEEMKHNIGGLEAALQDCELRIEQLEALIQIREVAEHLQDLAIQARTLNIMYKSSSDRGRELALLLDRVKTLGLRVKVYL